MRVLFFNYEYPPLGGGAGNATSYILREFSKNFDLSVDLITASFDNVYHKEKIGERITIYRIPIGKNKSNLHFQSKKDLLIYTWRAYFFARRLIKNNQYNLSHSFFTVPCGFLSLLFRWQYKLPYIVSLRGADVPGYSERFTHLYFFIKPLVRLIWSGASVVAANSQGLSELAHKTFAQQEIRIIYNGINTGQFAPDRSQKTDNIFRIICVSRITPRKGIHYLIKAVVPLVRQYPNIKLQIVGEGNEKENLEMMTRELSLGKFVDFIGMVSHSELPRLYAQADVFVLPSLNEGMSNTMLEALASGLPLVATDTGGTQELLRDGENGFIVKKKDSADIADKLERIINSKELREKMSQSSRIMAGEFSWEKVAGEYMELYERIKG